MNKLLQRQLIRQFGAIENVPVEFQQFFKTVNETYDHMDRDRTMLERSIELSSNELLELNSKISKESENMKLLNDRLLEAESIVHLGSWLYLGETNSTQRSAEYYKIFNMEEENFPNERESFLLLICPEDRSRIRSIIAESDRNHAPYSYETKICLANGIEKFILVRGKVELNSVGGVKRKYGTIQDITERKLIMDKLEIYNKALVRSNEEMDKFIYSISHDIRGPLVSMLGVLQILEDDGLNEGQLKSVLMIKRSLGRLDDFIRNVLVFSTNNNSDLSFDRIDFNVMLDSLSTELDLEMKNDKSVNIIYEINNKETFVSDSDRISVVFKNILMNSIRFYSLDQNYPFVKISIDINSENAIITILDNGIGIEKEDLEKIFDMFTRFSSRSIGSGLGLYLTKEIISNLKGTISVESKLGVGTKFTILLPNIECQQKLVDKNPLHQEN